MTEPAHVVLEASMNWYHLYDLLEALQIPVTLAHPLRTRAIAEAKVKTDKVDTEVLVHLLAGGWLPDVWVPDDQTQTLRQQVAHGARLVQQRTRLKNRVHALLHRNLVPGCPRSDLFGKAGRRWLVEQALPTLPSHNQAAVEATLLELDVVTQEAATADQVLASAALDRADVRRLMTIPGVDVTVALSLVAAIGDVWRFRSPVKLVRDLRLGPRVRQSGAHPASYGPITKQGRAHARGMVVEAGWAAAKVPGPLRAFYQRVRARRGAQIAAMATARKITVLAWHLLTCGEEYAFARPSLMASKRRGLELHAGLPPRRGQRGAAYGYSLKAVRRQEWEVCVQAERAYKTLTARWQPHRPRKDAGATKGARSSAGRS